MALAAISDMQTASSCSCGTVAAAAAAEATAAAALPVSSHACRCLPLLNIAHCCAYTNRPAVRRSDSGRPAMRLDENVIRSFALGKVFKNQARDAVVLFRCSSRLLFSDTADLLR